MKQPVVFLAAALLAASAHAQLYRCQKGGGIVYSETPCAPIVLGERFICRLTPQDGIDERYTEDYVNRHKGGQRL